MLQRHTHLTRVLTLIATIMLVAAVTQLPAGAGNTKQSADVLDWDREVVIDGDVSLKRTANGIQAKFSVGAPAGHMLTGWFIAFNNPEACTTTPNDPIKCGEYDIFKNPAVDATVSRITGHVTGSNGFSGAGRVSVGKAPVGAERLDGEFENDKTNEPLSNPTGSEVHVVWEDHDALDPELMPDEIKLAGGTPIAFALFPAP